MKIFKMIVQPSLALTFLALAGCASYYLPVTQASGPSIPQSRESTYPLPLPIQRPPTSRIPVSPPPAIAPSISGANVIETPSAPSTPKLPAPVEKSSIPHSTTDTTAKVAMLHEWVNLQERLYHVAAPLLINNTELCPAQARNILGLTAKTKYSYSENFVEEAQSALGLEDHLRVMSVLPGSGAASAGIQTGDLLLKVNIENLPDGANAETAGASLIASEMQGRSSLSLGLLRDSTRMTLDVPLTPACAMVIDLGNSDSVNSYSDGRRVMITRGMMGFVQSDTELAYVLAKEIAHNVLAQSPRPDIGAVIEQLHTLKTTLPPANIDAGIAPFTPVLDATTDKLALYLLVRAGYDIENVTGFWTRLADAYPVEAKSHHTALHPATKYRLSVVEQIIKTIQTKRDNNLDLVP